MTDAKQQIDVNIQGGRSNSTALHWAVHIYYNQGAAIFTQLLSDDRIDTSLKDNHNQTPLKFAIKQEEFECARILREHGAPEPSSSEEEEDDNY